MSHERGKDDVMMILSTVIGTLGRRPRALVGVASVALTLALTSVSCATPIDNAVVLGGSAGEPAFGSAPDGGDASSEASPPPAMCIATTCLAPFTTCPGDKLCETDLSNDNANCGACGNVCPVYLDDSAHHIRVACVDGACKSTCVGGYADCDGAIDTGCEVKIVDDPENCGGCGIACNGQPCIKGNCGCPPANPDLCDGVCTNVEHDDSDCGQCGRKCEAASCTSSPETVNVGERCNDGQCVVGCRYGHLDCDGDLSRGCGASNGCETRMGSENCGGCGIECPPGFECVAGALCVLSCTANQQRCGSKCVDVENDPMNCGGCGIECADAYWLEIGAGAHTAVTCRKGVCVAECEPGWARCHDGWACDTNLLRDPANCGACGVMCEYAQGQPCVGGQCLMRECDAGVTR